MGRDRNPACSEEPRQGRGEYRADDRDAERGAKLTLAEFIPEATPAWDFGTPDMKVLVIAELTMPTPTPNSAYVMIRNIVLDEAVSCTGPRWTG